MSKNVDFNNTYIHHMHIMYTDRTACLLGYLLTCIHPTTRTTALPGGSFPRCSADRQTDYLMQSLFTIYLFAYLLKSSGYLIYSQLCSLTLDEHNTINIHTAKKEIRETKMQTERESKDVYVDSTFVIINSVNQ